MQSIAIFKAKDKSFIHLLKSSKPYASSTAFPAKFRIPLDHPIPQTLFQSLKQKPSIQKLKRIHCRVVTCGVWSHGSLATSLINSYVSANELEAAIKLFDAYPSLSPPTLVWNLLIGAYLKLKDFQQEPFFLFRRMLSLDRGLKVFPDEYTYTFVATSCSDTKSLKLGEAVHGSAVKTGLGLNLFVGNSFVKMYSVFRRMDNARKLFDELPKSDKYSWNILLRGYAKSGLIGEAREVFDRMPERNEAAWVVMISGLVDCERHFEALRCFNDMLRRKNVRPNEAVLVSALSACSGLGALDQGKWIHSYIEAKHSFSANVASALINMYAKCGRIERAREVFDETSFRDVSVYTSMISGLSIHGLGREAEKVFSRMLEENVKPNEVTIIGLLNGFSHSGLVDEGSSVFSKMETEWGIVPRIEHYGCYVDLLGRAGFLERAFEFVNDMPIQPDIVIWRALLSACRIHRRGELGERIAKRIEGLSDDNDDAKVLLSNLNAYLGKWERVSELRNTIREKRTNRSSPPGCSWIEVHGVVHEFRVDDQIHPMIKQIREKLSEVLKRARYFGDYVTSSSQALFDLNEEDKEQLVVRHSEKLAAAFGLIVTSESKDLIRIVKNLRTCDDCHSALKAISLVYDREFVVRDRSRFHHFKDGICSCNDYW